MNVGQQSQHDTHAPDSRQDIAIVGMSCRFPGARNYDEFWRNLTEGRSSVGEVPADRWDRDAVYSPDVREPNKTTSKWGGFVDGVEYFDADFFGISAREAAVMDPQQRLMLEQAWACLEDAGYDPAVFSGTRTGVYVGVFTFDYRDYLGRALENVEAHVSTGTHTALIPNRISYFLNLHGPSLPIDTACSSSLVALHKAAHAIRRGECEQALVGGVSVLCSPTHFISFAKTGMLSPDGSCKTFDERANGYVRGEGAAMVLLKPLDAAIRDNDRVLAVLRGTAMNHGGHARTVTYPGSLAQSNVVAHALREADVPVASVSYVEAHGTGTPKGDPIEIEGLKMAFARVADERGETLGERSCGIGAVKTNIGHLESVAGMAGLIKTMLCMKHKVFPPLVHYQRLNPRISLDDSPFFIVDAAQPWTARTDESGRELPRRAGISSFGFGGVNAHVVVEAYPETARVAVSIGPALVVLSARTNEALRERATQLIQALDTREVREAGLADLAYTLQVGRQAMAVRLAFVATSLDDVRARLAAWLAGTPRDDIWAGQVPVGEANAPVTPNDDLSAVGRRWVRGDAFDWSAWHAADVRRRLALPTYPFARERHWVDMKPGAAAQATLHPLLHRNTSTVGGLRFSSRFSGDEPYLADHVVRGERTLPAAAQLEMLRGAAELASATARDWRVKDVVWLRPIVVADAPKTIHVALFPEPDGALSFEVHDDDTVYTEGALAPVDAVAGRHDLDALRARCPTRRDDLAALYEAFDRIGLAYGPAHRVVGELLVGDGVALARLVLPESQKPRRADYVLHPSVLDGALQAAIACVPEDGALRLPFALASLDVTGACHDDAWAVIRTRHGTDGSHAFDIDLCDDTGVVRATLGGLTVRPVMTADAVRTASFALAWHPRAASAAMSIDGRHRVMLFDASAAAAVSRMLPEGTCILVEGQTDVAAHYEAAALRLLEELASLVAVPGRHRIQVVVPTDGERHLLAGLGGLLRTASLENPRIAGQLIEVDAGQDMADALRINRNDPAQRIRHAGGVRHVAAWEEVVAASPPTSPWRTDGTYLITGGAGGLGLIVAREIARQARGVTLVLTGRSSPGDAIRARIAELEALSARASYRPLDVGDRAATEALVGSLQGLRGIVHAAGVLRDSLIVNKTPDELRDVFRAKVAGTLHLDAASRDLPLDVFLCFASTSGALGNVGQADYAAANAFMDAFAAHRTTQVAEGVRQGRTLAIDWPLWEEGGMRVDAATLGDLAERAGLRPLRTASGLDALHKALAGGASQVMVAEGAIRTFKASLEPAIVAVSASAASDDATPDALREKAERYFVRLLAGTLGRPAQGIDPQARLEAYGIDSILVMELTRALEQVFGPLSKTLLFEYQTLAELTGHFLRDHRARLAEALGDTSTEAPIDTPRVARSSQTPSARRPRFGTTPVPRPVASMPAGAGEIAIVGVAGRYPQAENLAQFWANLSAGRDSITEIPGDRWDHTLYFDADRNAPGKTYSKWGGFLDGIDRFDPLFFNISPRDAALMDPQERLFLECVHATLEDAGYTRENVAEDGNVGVFAGVMYEEYQLYGAQAQARGQPLAIFNSPASVANRVSYFCNFHGPSMALDTMCSSSLTAIHLACQSLQRGECAVAIAGGVNATVHPNKYLMLAQGRFISGKGRCESFGEGGEGYVPGEGVGAVLLKPLAQAQADGDHIYGVIRATAVNHGGKTNGYTVPNPNAQAKVIERALRIGGVDARQVNYIEAHGTGTSLGDPIEIAGLAKAFRAWTTDTGFCAIGSAKSNIGHCESAAGIAGVTKVLLQLRHGQIAPSLHSQVLNPNIDFTATPFVVQQTLANWERPVIDGKARSRLAGISSFGAGGANAHVVIEEYVAPAPVPADGPALVVLSARDEERLRERVRQLVDHLAVLPPTVTLHDLAYTLQVGREAMDERLGLLVHSLDQLRDALTGWLDHRPGVDDLYRGHARKGKETLSVFAGDDDVDAILDAWFTKGHYGKLLDVWTKGFAVDWRRLHATDERRRVSLPTYPFARERYWVDVPAALPSSVAGQAALHPLLHRNLSDMTGPRFGARFDGTEVVFADHVVQGRRMLPAAAQLEMVLCAIAEALGDAREATLKHVTWLRPIVAGPEGIDVRVSLYPEADGAIGFDVHDIDERIVYAQGSALTDDRPAAVTHDLDALRRQPGMVRVNADDGYAALARMGLAYGPAFRGIRELHVGPDLTVARLAMPSTAPAEGYLLHPAMLDAALQATLGVALVARDETPRVPSALATLQVIHPTAATMWAVVRYGESPDVDLCDDDGVVCVRLAGLRLTPMPAASEASTVFMQRVWRPEPATSAADTPASHSVWLCGVDATGLRDRMPGAVVMPFAADDHLASRYEAAACQLLERLQALRDGRHLVQVVVPAEGDDRLFAGLVGMLRTAHLENRRIEGQVIVVEPGQDIAAVLHDNCHAGTGEVRYIGGERQVAAWSAFEPTPAPVSPWKDHGVYLITGGAGGLGLIVARAIALAVRHPVLVLTGRSAMNDTIRASVRMLEALGAVVRYHAADVADAIALGELVRGIPEAFESLDGIVHSAGVVRDGYLAGKTPAQLREVFAAKVAGTLHLDAATRDMPLDCFVVFSSIAGALGNVGQADYAAANAFMDAFATRRAGQVARGERQGRTLSINWPLWDEGGMRADEATRAMLSRQWGMQALATDAGIRALDQALAGDAAQVLVVHGDAARIHEAIVAGPRPAATAATAATVTTVESPPSAPASADTLLDDLRHMVSALIKVKPEDLDGDSGLSEYGFDSITFTEFSNALNRHYGLELTPTVFFEYTTLRGLAGHLVRDHGVSRPPAAATAPARAVVTAPIAVPAPAARARVRRGFAVASPAPVRDPVAIIGMSGRFPGAADINAFWHVLHEGRDAVGVLPDDRADWHAWYAERAVDARTVHGGFIDGLDAFDPVFFGISPREAESMDPQQRLMMIHVWKALEDAGYAASSLAGSDTGLYVGTMPSGYGTLASRAGASIEGYSSTGTVASVGPNRMSYFLDLHGPSEPVETACSSSLVALRRAVLAIERGDCALAIAGGVNTLVNPELHISFQQAGMLSPDGRCKTFAAGANGYVRGEGVAMLVLKRLSAAERDGDHVYGLIRGTAENHGGRANSLTAPNPSAQAAVVRQAYEDAGVDPRTVGYIEAHGTGTPLGDPVEINGLRSAFRALYAGATDAMAPHCGLGSVKTNIGHLELAAGVAGVVKVLLQMKHRTLVKSLHAEVLNPYIDLTDSPFYVVDGNREWLAPRDADGRVLPRRAGVSSFGFGGVNAHVVIEEYVPSPRVEAPDAPAAVILSALDADRLREQVEALRAFLPRAEVSLADIAHTLQVGRDAMACRFGVVVSSLAELEARLAAFLDDGRIEPPHGALGALVGRWLDGQSVAWPAPAGGPAPRRVSLPTYPFARERYWIASGTRGATRLHPLVHRNVSDLAGPRFSSRFEGAESFLADHRVGAQRVLPGVAQLEMARFAVAQAMGTDAALHLRDVVWSRPVVVDDGGVDLHVSLHPRGNGEVDVDIHDVDGIVHGQGRVTAAPIAAPDALDLDALRREVSPVDVDGCYARFEAMGLHYGPAYRGMKALFVGDGVAIARVEFAGTVDPAVAWPPGLLDAAWQASIGLRADADAASLRLPFALDALDAHGPCDRAMWAVARARDGSHTVDIDLCDDAGRPALSLRGLAFRAVGETPSVEVAVPAAVDDDFLERATGYFERFLATALKLPAHRIDRKARMEAYGIDSLMVLELTRSLEGSFGPLPKTLFFEYQTLAGLSGYFATRHRDTMAALLGQPRAVAAVASAPAVRRVERSASRYAVRERRDAADTIAIVGVAGRYPQAENLAQFWANLSAGRDSITEIPGDRWDHSLYFDAERGKPGKTYGRWGGFLDGVDRFDPLFFNISPREAERMDPQERLFLECVHATLEDAGYTRANVAANGSVGVFAGVMYEEYPLFGAQAQARGEPLAVPGHLASIANRVSYFCDFHGPSMALDTMCSSSLTAIHLACHSLQRGECAVAIAGGVNVSIHPNKYLTLGEGRFISGKGRCESFGEGGEGYVPGEGVGAVLLKPLAQAEADGDHIYGVIRATAVNHGGKTNGYTVPNPNAQATVIEQALRAGGVDAREVSYVEAHGTGTSLGDPIEIAGLSKAFAGWTTDTGFCAIGSAKSNIGHCESAAGIAGVTKVLL
ncbi:SDR family NAD(P)-dependent oxidoreductase, partial [Luteibacter sp. PPL552]